MANIGFRACYSFAGSGLNIWAFEICLLMSSFGGINSRKGIAKTKAG